LISWNASRAGFAAANLAKIELDARYGFDNARPRCGFGPPRQNQAANDSALIFGAHLRIINQEEGVHMVEGRTGSVSKLISLTSEHSVAQAFWIVTFAIFTAIGAQIEIPLKPVPLTLQTMFVLLAGAFLGKRNGFISMSLYLGFGAVGLPVFAGARFGILALLGPTGGYLLAFPFAAFVIGYLVSLSRSRFFVLFAMTVGLAIIFAIGTVQLNFVYFHNWNASLQAGLLAFSVWDIVKLLAASSVYSQFLERIRK
jgi:biotin transport system substrate-specific component